MLITKVFIDDIKVGERRREDFGDIDGLTDSIAKYGLFHPIVIDDQNNLIAGERRLRACKQLRWDEIPARLYSELTEEERSEIELEENIRRKDLTSFEASKQITRHADIVTPLISTAAVEKDSRGRKSKRDVPKKDVAQALGIGTSTLVRAEQHVEAVNKYPELNNPLIPQKDAITIAKSLDDLPVEARTAARAKLIEGDTNTKAKLAGKPPVPPPLKFTPKQSSASRWREGVSRARQLFKGINDNGGPLKISEGWTGGEMDEFYEELKGLREEMEPVMSELEGGYELRKQHG